MTYACQEDLHFDHRNPLNDSNHAGWIELVSTPEDKAWRGLSITRVVLCPTVKKEDEGDKSPIPTVSWTPPVTGHKYPLGFPDIQTTRTTSF